LHADPQPHPDRADDHRLASVLAVEAGRLLVELRDRSDAGERFSGGVGDAGDVAAHRFLVRRLSEERPDDAVLSEEGVDDPRRLHADRVWIVDPLDGTREFGERGRADWAVHVALWEDGELVAGAVSLPALGVVVDTEQPPPGPTAPLGPHPRIVVSRSRPPAAARHVANELDGRLVPLGSAGAKAMAVVLGEADAYVHAGGQYEWDSAAPAIVASTAGFHVSRLDGTPLRYNQPDVWLPDLVICRPELAEPILTALVRR
jgi:3'(2'), 5'-bisphosphate nucleotidase